MKKQILAVALTLLTAVAGTAGLSGCGKNKVGAGGPVSYDQTDAVRFDFSRRDGTKTQYIKKFDQFATTWGFVGDLPGYIRETSINQLSALKDLKAESMRFDLFMGYTGVGYKIGSTAELDGSSDAEYAQMMQIVRELEAQSVLPQLVLFACPAYAQSYGSWKSKPIAEKWEELCRNMAAYFKQKGVRIGGYEMWNEPEFATTYFDGDWEDYIDTYLAGAKGIKSADPDAVVQALSAAWIHQLCATVDEGQTMTRWERFVSRAAAQNLLPDAISWHFYGRDGKLENIKGLGGDGENFSVYRQAILKALTASQGGISANDKTAYADLATMQQHLNEFNVYQPLAESSREMWNGTAVVPGMFDAIETLLAANDITRVNWATFLSEQTNGVGCSAVDLYSLQRYPAYHVNWMYGRLPVNRIVQPSLGEGLQTLAASDAGRAGLIVYNAGTTARSAKVALTGLPFDRGDVTVYLVDDEHLTYSTHNEPCVVTAYRDVDVNRAAADLNLLPNGVYYIEVNAADGTLTDLDYDNPLREHIVRKDYYYPQRGDNTPYAEIHENSLTAYLAMNGNAAGTSAAGVTLAGMKSFDALTLDYETWGTLTAGAESALGVKVDFETAAGYTKSVYYSLQGLEMDLALPFGAKAMSGSHSVLGNPGRGSAQLNLSGAAPSDWTGRIVVSYLIQNAGSDATARLSLRV